MGNKFNADLDKKRRSAKERARAWELKQLQKAGKISGLSEQVTFNLLPKQEGERPAVYIADFTYWENGKFVVEDVKGYRKGSAYANFVLKRKMMLYFHGITIKEV